MSSAFLKEGDSEQLKDIAPNMASLLLFLNRKNGGPVRELRVHIHERFLKEVHEMSDGLGYMINDDQQWQIVFD